ncbi:MAG: hypothetical protein GWP05_01585 [Anaerolineaceae bacterium]|nr:hypothetical protein [Anaerolineaceae bacterium]
MVRTRWMVLGLVAVMVLGSATWAGEKEKPEDKQKARKKFKLPEAVAAAIKKEFPKARIEDVEKERESGLLLYEVELEQGEDEIEVEVSSGGVIISIEMEIQVKDLPKVVAEAIRKEADGGEIEEVEKEETRAVIKKNKEGQPVLAKLPKPRIVFEAELEKGDAEAEVGVAADGKVIKPAKWKQDDDDDD